MSWDIPHYAALPCPRSTVSCVYRESRNVPGHPILCYTAMFQVYSVLCVLGQVGMSQDIPHSAALPCSRSTVSCVYWDKWGCPRTSHTLLHYHVPGLQCPVCTRTSRDVPGHPTLCCTTMSQVYSVLCAPGQVGTSHTTLHCHVPGLQCPVCTGKAGMSRDIPYSATLPCPRSTVSCVPWDK